MIEKSIQSLICNRYINAIKVLLGLEDMNFKVQETHNGVAYTIIKPGKNVDIYINPGHEMFNTTDKTLNIKTFLGVLIHEMLHKKYTNPEEDRKMLSRPIGKVINKPNLYLNISNIVEDFIIEVRCNINLELSNKRRENYKKAYKVDLFTLDPLKCLDLARLTSWRQSPPISEDDAPWIAFQNAMLQFILGPFVPGSKVSPAIQEDLTKILSEMASAIEESPKERAIRSKNIYDIVEKYLPVDTSEPQGGASGVNNDAQQELSEDELESLNESDRMKTIKKILQKAQGKGKSSESKEGEPSEENGKEGSSSNANSSENGEPKSTKGSSKGKEEDEKSDAKAHDESGKAGSSTGENKEEGTPEAPKNEDSSDGEKKEDEAAESEKTDEVDKSESSESEDDTGSNAEESEDKKEEPAEEKDSKKEEETEKSSESEKSDPIESDSDEKDSDDEDEADSPFTCDEEMASHLKDLESEILKEKVNVNELLNEAKEDAEKDSENTDKETEKVEVTDVPAYSGMKIKCKNYTVCGVSDKTVEDYNNVVEENHQFISRFSNRMKNIINEEEQVDTAKSGRLRLMRYAQKSKTSINLFEKANGHERGDCKVLIMLDVSGSMSGRKIAKAKTALVCIVEGLCRAGIPLKVITFTEDSEPAVVHHHYVNYSLKKKTRASIMQIRAGGNNFDGYSIRYGLKDLLKTKNRNTLMIVISDGQPASCFPCCNNADAAEAVKEAKRKTRVIGIGIDSNKDVLREFYQDTFIELTNLEDLMNTLGKTIVKEARKWT